MNPNNRLNDYLRGSINTTVSHALSWRKASIPPLLETPEDAERLIRVCYGDDVRDAQMRLFALAPEACALSYGIYLNFLVPSLGTRRISIASEKSVPVWDVRRRTHNPQLYPGLEEWLTACYELDQQHSKDLALVSGMLEQLGTYGQLLRMWPSFVNYLPGKDRLDVARQQVKRSPLPMSITIGSTHHVRFDLQEKLQEITTRLAEGTLMKSVLQQQDEHKTRDYYMAPFWPEAM